MEADEELAGAELVGVHGVEEDPLLGLDGDVLPVELWRHGTPHLGEDGPDIRDLDLASPNGGPVRVRTK